jgi:D,D-heptose 1,7-bisphosphate phosphatase
MAEIVRQAVILVGGRGTRLRSLAARIPKPLMPVVGDRRFLDVLVDHVVRQGFNDILLLAGHLGDQVADRYSGRSVRGARLRVVVEPKPHGTAGALRAAIDLLDERFVLLNGDTYFDCNIRALAAEACRSGITGTLALRRVEDARRYGTVELDGRRITAFREKDPTSLNGGLVSGGVYCLDKSIVAMIDKLPASLEEEVFPKLVAAQQLEGIECGGYFLDIGLPDALDQARHELPNIERRPAVFLDRDGVLNIDHGYVHRPEQVDWVDGAFETIRRFNNLGYYVFVVTNQAGIARAYYSEEQVHSLHAWMSDRLAEQGAFVDAFYYCPFHPDGVVSQYRGSHPDRKPEPGMIRRALSEFSVDVSRSFLIGDQEADIECARRGGIPGYRFPGGNLVKFVEQSIRLSGADSH